MDLFARLLGLGTIMVSPFVGSMICRMVDLMPNGMSTAWSCAQRNNQQQRARLTELLPAEDRVSLGGMRPRRKTTVPIRLLAANVTIVALTVAAFMASPPHLLPIAVCFGWILFALAQCDIAHGRLPDILTIPLCAIGLAWSTQNATPLSTFDSVIGALLGVSLSFVVASLYRGVTRRDGLGGGDIKLFGASGAWIGWQSLPTLLVLASLTALVTAAATGRFGRTDQLPFGPFIAFATFGIWCWQQFAQ